jgi:hypothetical protein
MANALIHLNDETGEDLYALEMEDDIGNWLGSFKTREEAEEDVRIRQLPYDPETGFRDTRHRA